MMGIMVPETCWASNKICNKNHLLHPVGILFPLYLDVFRYEYATHRDYCQYCFIYIYIYIYIYMMLRINLFVFNGIHLTINLLEPSHYNILRTEMNAGGDSTHPWYVGDKPTNISCDKYHKFIGWKMSFWKSLQILSSLLASQHFIMNKTVPERPRDLLTTWPVLIRHYLSIVCVISSICNFIQIIPDSGCLQKPFSRSQSALNLAESNNSLPNSIASVPTYVLSFQIPSFFIKPRLHAVQFLRYD